jgi:dihydroflavonol-4-reductase
LNQSRQSGYYQFLRGKNSLSTDFFARGIGLPGFPLALRGIFLFKRSRMRALVTGANGFLGAWLTRRLVGPAWSVRCLVRRTSGAAGLAGLPVELMYGDVVDAQALRAAIEDCQVVFHLAGIRRAPSREVFFRVNAEGTRNLCRAMSNAKERPRLVLCSSLAASGPSSPDRPRREEDPLSPQEWYGESKAEAERIASSFAGAIDVAVARPCRILGPGDRENLVFFNLVKKGIRLSVAGAPRPLSMVDVDDVAALMLLLATRPEAIGEAFFVANGETTLEALQDCVAAEIGCKTRTVSVRPGVLRLLGALADGASRISGKHLPLNRKLVKQLLAPAWTCSAEKAKTILGYRPTWSIPDSVRRSVAWYLERGWL